MSIFIVVVVVFFFGACALHLVRLFWLIYTVKYENWDQLLRSTLETAPYIVVPDATNPTISIQHRQQQQQNLLLIHTHTMI